MTIHQFHDIPREEIMPGFHGKLIHTPSVTIAHWLIDQGASLPTHEHPQEQVTRILTGTFEMQIGSEQVTLEAGHYVIIPPNVPHSGRAITACEIEDVFQPARKYS